MATFPMPDRMPAEMAHDFVKRVCLDGITATISAFILGGCLAALWSELVRRRAVLKDLTKLPSSAVTPKSVSDH